MRYAISLIAVVAALWGGNFVYTMWIRPVDQPTRELVALEGHFNRLQVAGHMYPVRHTFSHARVSAVAAFQIDGYPLPFGLTEYATEDEAVRGTAPRPELPPQLQPLRQGRIVLDFTFWGDDTVGQAQIVRQAFGAFRQES